MNMEDFISLEQICTHYDVEVTFINKLGEYGLLEIKQISSVYYVHIDHISSVEKMIRMYRDLNVNIEGIDVAFNLLQKVEALQLELVALKNRLLLYEQEWDGI